MSNSKKRIPKIRFKGFSEEWKTDLLFQLANFSKGSGYSKNDLSEVGIPIILYGRLYTQYQTAISDVNTFVAENNGSIISKGNEVLVPASGETAEDIARASAVIQSGVILGGDLNVIYPNEEINSIFLALSVSNGLIWRELSKKAQGKSVVHLRNGDLQEVELKYPIITEQTQIGNYFQNIDTLITASQNKLDKLKNIKKACLEKMFPCKGATIPEIRFKGFSGEWEEKMLGEIADIVGGGTPSTGVPEFWNGDIDWYSPVEIGGNIFVNGSQKKITELGLKNCSAKILPVGTVLFSSRAGIGSVAILSKEGSTNQGFQSIVPHKNELNTYFIFSRSGELKQYGETNGAGSTFIEVSGKQMASMPIICPPIAEQKQIGNYFQTLDKLISQHEQQLIKLKNIKKGCLEKMFVNTTDAI